MNKRKITITKEFSFDSSHRLHDPEISDERNRLLFGKCNNLPSHGHTYKLFVTISGPIKHGMMINFSELKKIVNEHIIEEYDHYFLNNCLSLKGKITTCEVMVDIIFEKLQNLLSKDHQDLTLEEIKLYETPTSYATIKNDA